MGWESLQKYGEWEILPAYNYVPNISHPDPCTEREIRRIGPVPIPSRIGKGIPWENPFPTVSLADGSSIDH
jgi:hypothetical protein